MAEQQTQAPSQDTGAQQTGEQQTQQTQQTGEQQTQQTGEQQTQQTGEQQAGDQTGESTNEPNKEGDRVEFKPEMYKLPEGVPEDVRKFAADNKFTQEQLDASLQQFTNYMQANTQAEQQKVRDMGDQFVKNWGDEAAYKLSLGQRALKQNDPSGALTKVLEVTGYGNHPAVLEFMANLGLSMQEGGFLKGARHKPSGQKTPAQKMYGDEHPSKEN